jgi:bifunctional polynucleotide phosphatase/kinase
MYRKPLPGMWYAIMDLYKQGTTVLDPTQVVFVGDAAGRIKDHSASDRLFAMNIGVTFHIPEACFYRPCPTMVIDLLIGVLS